MTEEGCCSLPRSQLTTDIAKKQQNHVEILGNYTLLLVNTPLTQAMLDIIETVAIPTAEGNRQTEIMVFITNLWTLKTSACKL